MIIKYKMLIFTLGACLFATSVASDYVYTEVLYFNRVAEKEMYDKMNVNANQKFNGYSIEEFGEGYAKPPAFFSEEFSEKLFEKKLIEVPVINQYPELPVGCEIVSAVSVLNYLGLDISKKEFTDKYIKIDKEFTFDENEVMYGPNPWESFVGDPYGWGYGCFPNVLADSLNEYFEDVDFKATAYSLDHNLNDIYIEDFIDEGVPIIVWATIDMKPFNYRNVSEWIYNDEGDMLSWYQNSHTLVLCGYDYNCFYCMDPNDKDEIIPYLRADFNLRYFENGFKAVAIKLDENMNE